MLIQIIYFICGILIPYIVEEAAYRKYIPIKSTQAVENTGTAIQGYGLRIIWDAAYFLVLLVSAYRIILSDVPFSYWQWLGYIVFLFGVGLRVESLKELGRFYDPGIVVKTDHQIIKTGPYRILRHPLHLGTLLKITGLAFFSPLWLALPVGFVSLFLVIYINRIEDQNHARLLGSSFQAYYLSTWDIVDLLWSRKK